MKREHVSKEAEQSRLIKRIFDLVPSGVGRGQKKRGLSREILKKLAKKESAWSVEQGFGLPQDLDHIESNGMIEEAELTSSQPYAKERGKAQLGTIGSGNHFVEIGEIEQILPS